MNNIYFVADIHLNGCGDKENKFISFLEMVASEKGVLYILGDLFDYWANNRKVVKKNSRILDSFKRIADEGVDIFFLPGNRDFLVSPKTFSQWGVNVVSDEVLFSSEIEEIYVTHGHLLCLDDKPFFQYQKIFWPIFKALDHILPGIIENWLASLFIKKSKHGISKRSQESFQISKEAVMNQFNLGASKVICGHTHQKDEVLFDDRALYVLPPWNNKGGEYGVISGRSFSFENFS